MRPIAIRQANLGRCAGVLGASARASLHDVQTKSAEVSRMMLNRSERVSRTHPCRGLTIARCAALSTQARNGCALSHSLVISHCEGSSIDWQSWSLT